MKLIAIMLLLFTLAVAVEIVIFIFESIAYKKSEYYKQTHFSFFYVRRDKGRYGEYCTYTYSKGIDGYKRYIFNCYLPKSGGETTEIDVILLHESGIYVFESKNYSGWIFGTETQKQWTQTLPVGRGRSQKSHFYNPIMQNKTHIKQMLNYLGKDETLPVYSYIVFSDRCTLKDITLTSNRNFVINRYNLKYCIQNNIDSVGQRLTTTEIDEIYERLYPCTQTSDEQKQAHIDNINSSYSDTTERKYMSHPAVSETRDEQDIINICPRCGAQMVKRTAKSGTNVGKEFWGCSRYPHCKCIVSIK